MRQIFLIIFLLTVTVSSGWGAIPDEPDQTMLWNQFSSASVVDSFAVLTNDNGVVVCGVNQTSGLLSPVTHLFLPTKPQTRKRFGDIMIVSSIVNTLYFLDLSDLPAISLLGEVELDMEINDFELKNSNLYVAAGFDGLFRYRLDNFRSATFLDSSMLGVHYVSVAIDEDRMYAVDDYNGVLTYDISGEDFGVFQHILYMPFRVRDIHLLTSDLAMRTVTRDIVLARWTDTALCIVDTATANFQPAAVYGNDSLVFAVGVDGKWFDLINRTDGSHLSGVLVPPASGGLLGGMLELGHTPQIIMPSEDGGVSMIDLGNLPAYGSIRPVYSRPGPIRTLFFHDSKLYTGGERNPLDAYAPGPDGKMLYEDTYFSGLNNVRASSKIGDSVFVLYPQVESIFLMEFTPEELRFDTAIMIDPALSTDLRFFNLPKKERLRALLGLGYSHFDIYVFSDTLDITKQDIFVSLSPILDIVVIDSLLVFSTNKFDLWIYGIRGDFQLDYRSTLSLSTRIDKLVALPPAAYSDWKSRLIGFSHDGMRAINLSDPSQPKVDSLIRLPSRVSDAYLENNRLYTVGSGGIGVFDISHHIPKLVDYGGRGGQTIAVEEGVAAISDGHSLHIYDLSDPFDEETAQEEPPVFVPSLANYPNPFNPVTNISYHLTTPAQVELSIYNLLGQRVTVLVDEFQSAGPHVTSWDGRDSRDKTVASGVYFCRLQAGDNVRSAKMLLVK